MNAQTHRGETMKISELNFPEVFSSDDIKLYLSIANEVDWDSSSNLKPHGRVHELINKKVFQIEEVFNRASELELINNWVAGQYDAR
jgi:hypothetical protein